MYVHVLFKLSYSGFFLYIKLSGQNPFTHINMVSSGMARKNLKSRQKTPTLKMTTTNTACFYTGICLSGTRTYNLGIERSVIHKQTF